MLSYVGRPPTTCMPMLSIMVSYGIPNKVQSICENYPAHTFLGFRMSFWQLVNKEKNQLINYAVYPYPLVGWLSWDLQS
jgi:hypothetical protein